jgi:hypothetical protein
MGLQGALCRLDSVDEVPPFLSLRLLFCITLTPTQFIITLTPTFTTHAYPLASSRFNAIYHPLLPFYPFPSLPSLSNESITHSHTHYGTNSRTHALQAVRVTLADNTSISLPRSALAPLESSYERGTPVVR